MKTTIKTKKFYSRQEILKALLRDQGLSTPDSFEWELFYSDESEAEVRGVSVNFIEQLESEE